MSARRIAPLYALCTCLALAAPAPAQQNLYLASAGGGATNRWFSLDVDEPIDALELRAGWGRALSPRLAWFVTLDLGAYDIAGCPRATSVGLTPRLRYSRGLLVVDGGMGLMRNTIDSEGYTYPYK